MTRINSAIHPSKLTDQHLIAELRELPRIFTAVNKRIAGGKDFDDVPQTFRLGVGHVKFFYNKLGFLHGRHINLMSEYNTRFNRDWQYPINSDLKLFKDLKLYNGYIPTKNEEDLLIKRISRRLIDSSQTPRYFGLPISKLGAINNLSDYKQILNKKL